MGDIQYIPAVRPIAGLLAINEDLLNQARTELAKYFGPVCSASEMFRFEYTRYYEKEMGAGMLRQFLVFELLRSPDELADWKLQSNQWEQTLGVNENGGRRVNIDPGYLAPGKLVLASTKDHEHRLYLQKGIYGEVTLRVRGKHLRTWKWTYPDYAGATEFFENAYQAYRRILAENNQQPG